MYRFIKLENKSDETFPLPNADLLAIHHQLAEAFAWLEVLDYMRTGRNSASTASKHLTSSSLNPFKTNMKVWMQRCVQRVLPIIRMVWTWMPVSFRAKAYTHLAAISNKRYGSTGSERTFKLPFNLYLRVSQHDWAPKHQAEYEALRLIQKYTTSIPAPRPIDTIHDSKRSFLLMTGLPGRTIGQMLCVMTDEQLRSVAQDLKRYLAELRRIPNRTGSRGQICNALGGGILDWRIGDSQRRELIFQDETQFNEFLIDDLPLGDDKKEQISKSHAVKHDIVFTHADINLRNVLVDDNARISGIVDWECAGWYPEYWECTKAHFTVRHTIRWLADVVDQVFPDFQDELHAENILVSMAPSW
jgi:aminoglycoside phosphotransferase